MDILIIYIIKTLLLPIASLLFMAIAGLFLMRRHQSLAMILISISIASLLILSLPITTKYMAATQEIYPPLNTGTLDNFSPQAIVILGGGLRKPAPEYQQKITLKHYTLARVRYGALIAKQALLPVLVSGGKVLNDKWPSEAEVMSDVLINEFNQAVQWQEPRSRNTAENAIYTQEILHKEGIQRIILVTHALHMRRAIEQFEKQGLKVIPAPTIFLSKAQKIDIFSFLPTANALQNSSLIIHEIIGRAWYALRY